MRNKKKRKARWLLWGVGLCVAALVVRFGGEALLHTVYPDHYREDVLAAAERYELPPSLLFAVIHTESGFSPDACSHAGAIGLMQVTEPTLQWAMMRTGGDTALSGDALLDPALNIDVGARVLSLLFEMFSSEDTALAAYNAGMGNVREWLADSRYSDDGVTLKAIPFEETKNYVKKVRFAQKIYQKVYNLP